MEPIVGVLVLIFVVLLAMSNSSSERDGRRHPRDSYRDDHRRSQRRRYRDDDWDDAYDEPYPYHPYWPPPYPYRRRRRGNTWTGILLGFFFAIVLVSVVAVYVRDDDVVMFNQTKPSTTTVQPRGTLAPEPDFDKVPETREPTPQLPPSVEYEVQSIQYLIRLKITDYVTFESIRARYPTRNIEAFRDKDGRYWVCIFPESSQKMDEIRDLLRLRADDLKEHGLEMVLYKTTQLCSGKLVREKGTYIWFCED
jgi:hypothetical protein